MPKAANYPDWVMKYKRKGTYINKVGDKYYLYAAHSERIKGTDKVRRISDGYLGRITEKEGLIPPKDKLKSANIKSLEFGLSYALICCTERIHSGLRKSFVKNGDLVYVCSILNYIYGFYARELFEYSYLKFHFPDLNIPDRFTDAQVSGIERATRMITDTACKTFGEDLNSVKASLSFVRLVQVDNKTYLSDVPVMSQAFAEKYSIRWEDALWQR